MQKYKVTLDCKAKPSKVTIRITLLTKVTNREVKAQRHITKEMSEVFGITYHPSINLLKIEEDII